MQNISDNVHTDVVSLLCESECGWLGGPSVQNISDNIHTDKVSLFEYETDRVSLFEYESEWESGEDASFHNISENSHIDNDFDLFFHSSCASQHVSAVCPNRKSYFYNKYKQTVLMNPW